MMVIEGHVFKPASRCGKVSCTWPSEEAVVVKRGLEWLPPLCEGMLVFLPAGAFSQLPKGKDLSFAGTASSRSSQS